jgi:hypothetical protein
MPLEGLYSFPDFFLSAYRYSFDIWYIALPYLGTDQVWVWFWSIDVSWNLEKTTNYRFSAILFLLCLQILISYIVHCSPIPRYRFSLSLALIYWFFTKLWPLDLEKNHELLVFRSFSLTAYRYSFNIWYIVLPYWVADQVWFLSIWISRSSGPWT